MARWGLSRFMPQFSPVEDVMRGEVVRLYGRRINSPFLPERID
jgi:hypothetical protein